MSETINSVLSDKLRDANETIVAQRSELDRLRSRERELVEALNESVTLIAGDLVGVEWKKACHAFIDRARAILKGGE